MTREEGRIREAGKQVGKMGRLWIVSERGRGQNLVVEQAGKNGRLWVETDQGRDKNQGSRETSREEGRVVHN